MRSSYSKTTYPYGISFSTETTICNFQKWWAANSKSSKRRSVCNMHHCASNDNEKNQINRSTDQTNSRINIQDFKVILVLGRLLNFSSPADTTLQQQSNTELRHSTRIRKPLQRLNLWLSTKNIFHVNMQSCYVILLCYIIFFQIHIFQSRVLPLVEGEMIYFICIGFRVTFFAFQFWQQANWFHKLKQKYVVLFSYDF